MSGVFLVCPWASAHPMLEACTSKTAEQLLLLVSTITVDYFGDYRYLHDYYYYYYYW